MNELPRRIFLARQLTNTWLYDIFEIQTIGIARELPDRRELRIEKKNELEKNSKRGSATVNFLCTKAHKHLVVSHMERRNP